MQSLAVILMGYLLGAIPFSYLMARWVGGIDIRTVGTRNVGAHNVMREVGRLPGTVALLLDVAKGSAAVLLARHLGCSDWVVLLSGLAAVMGHNFPFALRFQGGRGMATSLGIILVLLPRECPFALAVLGLLYLVITRSISFSALISLTFLAFLAWKGKQPLPITVTPLALLGLMGLRQLPEAVQMWRSAGDKKALILNEWIFDRDAEL